MVRIEIRNLTKKRIPPVRLLRRAIKKVLKLQKIADGELDLVFMTDAQIRKLNLRYRGKNRPTDVLAFSMKEGKSIKGAKHILGDIAISVDAAKRQAKGFNSTKKKEIYLYVIHGILHLLGHDDGGAEESACMQKRQNQLLGAIF